MMNAYHAFWCQVSMSNDRIKKAPYPERISAVYNMLIAVFMSALYYTLPIGDSCDRSTAFVLQID